MEDVFTAAIRRVFDLMGNRMKKAKTSHAERHHRTPPKERPDDFVFGGRRHCLWRWEKKPQYD